MRQTKARERAAVPFTEKSTSGGQNMTWGCDRHTERSQRDRVQRLNGGSQLDSWALSAWIGPANAGREADAFLVTPWHPQTDKGCMHLYPRRPAVPQIWRRTGL